jgi:hypothetical protein
LPFYVGHLPRPSQSARSGLIPAEAHGELCGFKLLYKCPKPKHFVQALCGGAIAQAGRLVVAPVAVRRVTISFHAFSDDPSRFRLALHPCFTSISCTRDFHSQTAGHAQPTRRVAPAAFGNHCVVRVLAWFAIGAAFSSVPTFFKYAVIPVARKL